MILATTSAKYPYSNVRMSCEVDYKTSGYANISQDRICKIAV
jgi:hypothetical protein